jgi:hypothetical protein
VPFATFSNHGVKKEFLVREGNAEDYYKLFKTV